MFHKLKGQIKNNRGNSYPLAVAIVLVLLMILLLMGEFFRLNIISHGIKEALQDSVISTVTENYDDVYHGVREGYSGAYQPDGNSFSSSIDYGDIYDRLDNNLGLRSSGGKHIKYSGESMEFYVSNLKVRIQNAPYARSDNSQRFKIESYLDVYFPILFIDKLLPPLQLKIKTTAGYTPIF